MNPIDEVWMSTHSPRRFGIDLLIFSAKLLLAIWLLLHFGEMAWDKIADVIASIDLPENPASKVTRLFADVNDRLRIALNK